jgi:hypothetical protein
MLRETWLEFLIFLNLFFYTEDGGSTFVLVVETCLPKYATLHPGTPYHQNGKLHDQFIVIFTKIKKFNSDRKKSHVHIEDIKYSKSKSILLS